MSESRRDFDYDRGFIAGTLELETQKALRLEAERQVEDVNALVVRLAKVSSENLNKALDRADAAERQVGELREQLENANDRAFCASEAHVITMAEFDTAMGLLREIQDHHKGKLGFIHQSIRDFLNTTSTEGKDHE